MTGEADGPAIEDPDGGRTVTVICRGCGADRSPPAPEDHRPQCPANTCPDCIASVQIGRDLDPTP